MMPTEYILFHRNGGWYTHGTYHSDYTRAEVFEYEDMIEMCKLHGGKLMPVEKRLYAEVLKK